jgi:hypothetical protein
VLGRGYYIGYSIALLGLDLNDTECEKKYMQVYNLARKENVPPDMVKPGVLFAAGALASPHWNSPAIKPADRNVQHLLKRHVLEIDSVQSLIDNEAHELHFQVLMRHKMRLITVYKAIADDHNSKTMVRIDRKPSKTQRAIRLGADQTEDVLMASSTNEPTAQKEAVREE